MMPEQITLGTLREATKDMSDDTVINFLYREDILNDDGKDYEFTPTTLWQSVEEAEEPFVTLVSTLPPESDEEVEECMDDNCACKKATIQ